MYRPTLSPRRGRRLLISAFATVLVAGAVAAVETPTADAAVPDTTVTINVSQTGKVATHAGAGFLYGLNQDGSAPSDSLLQPLAPTLFRGGGARLAGHGWIGDGYTAGSGYNARITSALNQARRVTRSPYNATYHLLVSDLYGADTEQPTNTTYPCDNSNCSNWTTFIDRVVADVQASGVNVAYDIWNEPDGTSFWPRGVNTSQYFQMWDTAVREIRRLSPSATIVGPCFSGYNHSWLDQFLGQTSTDNTVPNVLCWHFGDDPVAQSTDAANLVSAHGLAAIPQSVNEFLFSNQQTAGYAAWFLSRLAISGVSSAAHAIWTNCCIGGTLDELLTGTGANQTQTGQWWAFRAYASLTGRMVTATSGNAGIAVAAAADQSAAQANILIGNNSGQTGTATVTITGLSSTTWLTAGTTVHATLRRIPNQTPLSAPLTVTDRDITISGGSISLPATFQAGTDAFWLTLSPHALGGTAGPTIVDGNVTGTGTNQFQYGANWGVTTGVADMYAGTANWTFTSGATATFRFTGTQVALHAVKDIDQGIMSVSVDGGTPANLDNYAGSRNASGIVWTSPVLAPGNHTITIANTGQRNPSSSGNNIAIDRADVTASSGTGTGSGPILSALPGNKCIDVSNNSTANGTKIQMWDCTGGAAQVWSLSNGTLAHAGKCMDVTGQATGNGALIQLYDCNGGTNQQWVAQADGSFRGVQSGRCLDDPGNNTTNGTQLVIWDCNGGTNQRWTPPA